MDWPLLRLLSNEEGRGNPNKAAQLQPRSGLGHHFKVIAVSGMCFALPLALRDCALELKE